MSSFDFKAEVRSRFGTRSARAMRRNKRIPAVLYGAGRDPVLFSLDQNDAQKKLESEAVYSHILTISIGGKQENVILKDLHRHPSLNSILHMDFQRVSKTDKLRVRVPLHFVGEEDSVGVKKGGVVTHNIVDMEVSCLPEDLPEFIEVDLSSIDLGDSIHLSEIVVPEGVEIQALMHGAEHDPLVASVLTAKIEVEVEDEDEGEEGPVDEEPSEEAEED